MTRTKKDIILIETVHTFVVPAKVKVRYPCEDLNNECDNYSVGDNCRYCVNPMT